LRAERAIRMMPSAGAALTLQYETHKLIQFRIQKNCLINEGAFYYTNLNERQ
jgi:hypothetical protein